MTKIISISGVIGGNVWPDEIRKEISNANGEDIEFQISSPGGYIYDGLEIFNLIRSYSGKTTTVALGMVASMASFLLMAGDVKKAMSNAIFMIHNARGFEYGDQNEHRKIANILEGMSNLLAREYEKQTGKSQEEIKSFMDKESFFFGEEIQEAGFVDEIIEVADEENVTRDEAIANASAEIAAVIEKIKSKPEDISKIAAKLMVKNATSKISRDDAESSAPRVETFTNRQSANNSKKMEEKMPTLDELLALNAPAQAEYNKRLGDAEKRGAQAKQDEIDRIHPLISAEGASPALIEAGFKALKEGGQQVGIFVGIAQYEARQQEQQKAQEADKEQKEDTANGQETTNPNRPKNAADMKSLTDELKNKIL